jgi:hypothetical protein
MLSPQSLISLKGRSWNLRLPQDPGSTFGGLLLGCIRDEWLKDDKKVLAEGVIFLLLGAVSSVATGYLLSLAGILV